MYTWWQDKLPTESRFPPPHSPGVPLPATLPSTCLSLPRSPHSPPWVGCRREQDGAGPASVSELVDFFGVLKRFSEDQLERLNKETSRPSGLPAGRDGGAGEAGRGAEEEEEEAVCDETAVVERGGGDCAAAGEFFFLFFCRGASIVSVGKGGRRYYRVYSPRVSVWCA